MQRWLRLFWFELKLFRSSMVIHLIGIVQPSVMYLIMSAVLVTPQFEMAVRTPETQTGWALVWAMERIGSPVGSRYIDPVLIDRSSPQGYRQGVLMEERNGQDIAIQHFNLIDSNMVKNYRNRLTAAAWRLWQDELGDRAVRIEEHPWLPVDTPYQVYFGVSIITMAVFTAASMVGAIVTANDFQTNTILEYRLSPMGVSLKVGVRLVRLILTSLAGGTITILVAGWLTGYWPNSYPSVMLLIVPLSSVAACVGILSGLLLRKPIPSFMVALVFSFVTWLLGGAFGLPESFGPGYSMISKLVPNTYALHLIFPQYFPVRVGNPLADAGYLLLFMMLAIGLLMMIYRQKVSNAE